MKRKLLIIIVGVILGILLLATFIAPYYILKADRQEEEADSYAYSEVFFDEYDEVENDYTKIDDNTFLINGSVSINDLKKILNVQIPEGDYDTLSGYLVEVLGRIPAEKEKPVIETEKAIYKVEKTAEKRIVKVKVCKNN